MASSTSLSDISSSLIKISETLVKIQETLERYVEEDYEEESVCDNEEVNKTEEELYIPFEHYEFIREDLDNISLRKKGYSMTDKKDDREEALDLALEHYEKMEILYHLYALLTVWTKNKKPCYVKVLNEDIDYIISKF